MSSRAFVTVALVLVAPAVSSAHGIGAEAKLKGERVHVEGFFDDDTPASDAKVTVTGEDGKVVAEGKTDAKGQWSFPVPAAGKYRVAVDAGGGHLAKTTITIPARPAVTGTHTSGTSPSSVPANQSEPETVVSDGPTRAEVTGGRWLKAGVGLAIIGLLTGGFWLATRWKARRAAGVSP